METVAITGGKIVGKVALNIAAPGSGSLIDFGEAIYDCSEGNYTSAAINVLGGFVDLFAFGFFGASKAAAKEVAKNAAVNVAKEATKTTTKQGAKEIGKKLGKEIAKGMIGDVTEEAFKQSVIKSTLQGAGLGIIGSGGKDVTKEVLEEATKAFIDAFIDEATKTTTRHVFSSATSKAAKEAAKTVADDYFKKKLAQDIAFKVGTGVIKYNQGQST